MKIKFNPKVNLSQRSKFSGLDDISYYSRYCLTLAKMKHRNKGFERFVVNNAQTVMATESSLEVSKTSAKYLESIMAHYHHVYSV